MANKRLVNSDVARRALEQMKFEIAQEMGIELSGNTAARLNGAVGGEMVKRLIALAEANMLQ